MSNLHTLGNDTSIQLERASIHIFEHDNTGKLRVKPTPMPVSAATAWNLANFRRFEQYLRDLIVDAVEEDPRTRLAKFVDHEPGTVAAQIDALFANPKPFHKTSVKLAEELLGCLVGGAIRPAYFILAEFRLAQETCFGILKLDYDEHLEVDLQTARGKPPKLVVHKRDLPTSNKLKDKLAFIVGPGERQMYDLMVTDRKYKRWRDHRPVAPFFLKGFLGARLKADTRFHTEIFLDVAKRFARRKTKDLVEGQVRLDLFYSGLQFFAYRDRVKISEFLKAVLPEKPALQDELREEFQEAGLVTASFETDHGYVEERAARRRLRLSNGISISGERAIMEDSMRIDKPGDRYHFEIDASAFTEN